MSLSSIPRPVLYAILGVVVIGAVAFFTLGKSDSGSDSGGTATTTTPSPPSQSTTGKSGSTASGQSSSSTGSSASAASSTSDAKAQKTAVKKAIKSWYKAIAAADGAKACSLMTADGRAEMREKTTNEINGKRLSCATVVEFAGHHLKPSSRAAFNSIQVGTVTVKGDTAYVYDDQITASKGSLTHRGGNEKTYLVNTDGATWLINGSEKPESSSSNTNASTGSGSSSNTTDVAEVKIDPTTLPKNVQKALEKDNVVVILFWRPVGVEDRMMQRVTGNLRRALHSRGEVVSIFQPGVNALTRWIKITGVDGVAMTPSYLVIGVNGDSDVQYGFIDGATMLNAILNDVRVFKTRAEDRSAGAIAF